MGKSLPIHVRMHGPWMIMNVSICLGDCLLKYVEYKFDKKSNMILVYSKMISNMASGNMKSGVNSV